MTAQTKVGIHDNTRNAQARFSLRSGMTKHYFHTLYIALSKSCDVPS